MYCLSCSLHAPLPISGLALGRQVSLGRSGGLARRNRRRSLNPMSALARVGSIWLVGCGNMGGAMLRGWLAQGLAPDRLTVIDPALPELPAGVRSLNALPDDEAGPEGLVLAVQIGRASGRAGVCQQV